MTEQVSAPRRKLPVLVSSGAALVVALLGWLIYGGLDKNIVYFLEPHELLARGTDAVDSPVRLGGLVRPGSVDWNESARALRFDITDTTQSVIRVVSTGQPPQMFRDGQGVVVEGRLGRDSVFAASTLIIKHTNEYRAPKAGEHPREAYKTLFKGAGP
ncbi:MAG: cytochrome c maturation protein CcmE [Gemmatimonadetes bacterium]|nr:cytochrome c maturation protein CcmE [Gemmatimonadota bacterium]